MSLKQQLSEGRLYSLTPHWRAKRDKAINDIAAMLRRCKRPYLALSWGKQSIVMAHMAWSLSPDVLCVHWTGPDAELIANFNSVSAEFLRRWPLNYLEIMRGEKLGVAVRDFVRQYSPDGVLVGISAFESRDRRITLRAGDTDNIFRYRSGVRSGMLRCCPLANWEIIELAAYISEHDIPLLNTYHRFGLAARTSTACNEHGRTAGAINYMTRANAGEMRKRWREKHESEANKNHI